MSDTVRVYLIVSGSGQCRLAKRRPTLDWDEVAFPIVVQIPPGWGRVYDDRGVSLEIPPPPDLSPPSVGEVEVFDSEAELEGIE